MLLSRLAAMRCVLWVVHPRVRMQWQGVRPLCTLDPPSRPRKPRSVASPEPGRSLADLFPDIAKQWHPTLNMSKSPESTFPFVKTKIWWSCPVAPDHIWQCQVGNRTIHDKHCPFCNKHRASSTCNLVLEKPELAKEWHPVRNKDLKPEHVTARSVQTVWWKCDKGEDHEWKARVFTRAIVGASCPFCAGFVPSATNNLAVVRPDLAAQWHPTLNGSLTPRHFTPGSQRRVWWKCPNGDDHVWQTELLQRSSHGTDCPFCSNRKACADNNLPRLAPELVPYYLPVLNDGKAPEQILASKHSVKKYYWMNPSDVTQPPLHATVSYMKRLVQNLASPRPWKPRNLKHSL